METYERIRELRKKHLKLNQTDFGKRLGVSRDVIKNIELNALARPEQKLSLYKLICSEFNVNEEWLLHGTLPMFVQSETFNLDDYLRSRKIAADEINIIKNYFQLEPEIRKMLIQNFRKILSVSNEDTSNIRDGIPATPEELEKEYPPINNDEINRNIG